VVDDPVSKISGKDLAQFWPGGNKTDRTGGAGIQLLLEGNQILFLVRLKAEGIQGVPFALPAVEILPVNVFKREQQGGSSSGANRQRVVVLVAVVEIEVPCVVCIKRILRTRPVVVGQHPVYPLMAENYFRPTGWESLKTGIPSCIIMLAGWPSGVDAR